MNGCRVVRDTCLFSVLAFFMISLIVLSAFDSSVATASPGSSVSGALRQGDYAYYSVSNVSIAYLAGYAPNPYGLSAINQIWYFQDNKTAIPFSSMLLGWKVASVRSDSYVVDYLVELSGYGGISGDTKNLSQAVIVSRQNDTVYQSSGQALGSWPYWLSETDRNPGTILTLVHRFPSNTVLPDGSLGATYLTPVEFVSLPEGGSISNTSAESAFFDSSLVVPSVGSFVTDRLLVTYPFFRTATSSMLTIEGNATGAGTVIVTSFWIGVYDRESGLLLAQDHSTYFMDDILLQSLLGVWQIGFNGASLVLQRTNIALSPDTQAQEGSSESILLIVTGIVVVFAAGGVYTTLHSRVRSKKR
jgi:hypothetical protein